MNHITDPIFLKTLDMFDLAEQANQPHMMLHVYHKRGDGLTCQGYRGNCSRPGLTPEQEHNYACNVADDMREHNIDPDIMVFTKPTYSALSPVNPYPALPTGYTVTLMVADENGTLNDTMYIRKFAMHWDAGRLSEYMDTTATIDPLLATLWNHFRAPTGYPDFTKDDPYLNRVDNRATKMLTDIIQQTARDLAADPTATPIDLVTTVHNMTDPDPANWRTNVAYFTDPDYTSMVVTTCEALRKLEDTAMHAVIARHKEGDRMIFTAQTARANGCPFQDQATATYMIGLCGKLVLIKNENGYTDPVAAGMWRAYHEVKA